MLSRIFRAIKSLVKKDINESSQDTIKRNFVPICDKLWIAGNVECENCGAPPGERHKPLSYGESIKVVRMKEDVRKLLNLIDDGHYHQLHCESPNGLSACEDECAEVLKLASYLKLYLR